MSVRKTFQTSITALFIFVFCNCVIAQDSLSVNDITIAPEDSIKARQVLNTEILPASEFWTELHSQPGNYSATNVFVRITKIAYPVNSPNFKKVYVDSILNYMDQVVNQHPNEGVRVEFLFKALQLAQQMGRENQAKKYYSLLTSEYGSSSYINRAQEFAPDRAIQVGNKLPEFRLPALHDTTQTYSNKDFLSKTFLIDFWGTWCGPCIKEMPYLHKAYEKYEDNGFTIFSVAVHDTYNAVQGFIEKEWSMPWQHSFIKDDSALEDKVISIFEVYGVPKTILVNHEGYIIATEVDLRGERLIETLENVFYE